MKTLYLSLLLVAVAANAALSSFMMMEGKVDPQCEKVLPAAAVGKAAKKSVTLAPVDAKKGRGGNCNYVAGEDIVLMLQDERVKDDARWAKISARSMYSDGHKDLPGVAEGAFTSESKHRNIAVGRKGGRALVLTSFLDPKTMKHALTVDQVAALLKQAVK